MKTIINLILFYVVINILEKATYLMKGKSLFGTLIRTINYLNKFMVCVVKVLCIDFYKASKKIYNLTNKKLTNKKINYPQQQYKKVVNGNLSDSCKIISLRKNFNKERS